MERHLSLPKLTRDELEAIRKHYSGDVGIWPPLAILQDTDLVIEAVDRNGQRVPIAQSRGDELLTVYRWQDSRVEIHKAETLSRPSYSLRIVGLEHARDEQEARRALELALALHEPPIGTHGKRGRPKRPSLKTSLKKLELAVAFWEWEKQRRRAGKRMRQDDYCIENPSTDLKKLQEALVFTRGVTRIYRIK